MGESILASVLPGGQDPLSVLDVQANTLGYLFILCVQAVYFALSDGEFVADQQGLPLQAQRLYRSEQYRFSAITLTLKSRG